MANERKEYTGGAIATSLTAGINAGDLSLTITDATGWPTGAVGKFGIVIDRGLAGEEKLLGTTRTGTTITITTGDRGEDGTAATSHGAGATVEHSLFAQDLDEANAHLSNASTSHSASAIVNVAAGGIAATNVQGAINELDAEKQTAAQVAATIASSVTPALIAYTQYQPSATTTITTASTSIVDADASNLSVSFTAPASGRVLVKLSGLTGISGSGGLMTWGVREGSTTLDGSLVQHVIQASVTQRPTYSVVVAVTASAVHTIKWAWYVSSNVGSLYTGSTAAVGPLVMEVWAAP